MDLCHAGARSSALARAGRSDLSLVDDQDVISGALFPLAQTDAHALDAFRRRSAHALL